jgi:predicted CXXCH cytochrome family protein
MKKLILAAALLLPVAASANIYNTKHNFAANTNAQSSDREICKYCHVPHKNAEARLIWNHSLAVNNYSWSAVNGVTKDGTPLPSQVGESKRCLSCHDGTVALGDVMNPGGGDRTATDPTFSGASTSGGRLAPTAIPYLGTNLSIDAQTGGGNHPIGVPYAAQVNYLSATGDSAAIIGEGGYWPLAAGWTTPSGVGGSVPLRLHRDVANASYGVECGTCHDPHGKPGIPYLLRVTLVESALCRSCHQK